MNVSNFRGFWTSLRVSIILMKIMWQRLDSSWSLPLLPFLGKSCSFFLNVCSTEWRSSKLSFLQNQNNLEFKGFSKIRGNKGSTHLSIILTFDLLYWLLTYYTNFWPLTSSLQSTEWSQAREHLGGTKMGICICILKCRYF